ncbi:MAG: hypothetical protein L0229_05255 [Blastocatellia bacterium]|nr:hypothetical protein [Blastocatellia bacterium]
MDEAPSPRKDWILTGEAFEKLLALFDPDPDIAAIRYEEMRHRLRKFFQCNGINDPDEHVDETFDRAARKIDEGIEIQNPTAYLIGIARFVLKEYRASRESKTEGIEREIPDVATADPDDDEDDDDIDERLECLEGCTVNLTPRERERVVDYYSGEKREKINNRIRLAREEDITLGNLRVRMHRLRERLEKCILECMKEKRGGRKRI